jgi:hypothetical protein
MQSSESLGVSVLIATRKRPKRLKTCIQSLLENKEGEVEVLTYVDDDDDSYESWTVKGPRFERAKMFRALVPHAKYDFLYMLGDDTVCKTKGWDRKMIEAFPPDRIAVVFGMDGWKNVPGHLMFHRKLYELTGAFPEEFEHFGPDTYLSDVAKGVNRLVHLKDVLIEHHHHRNGKAENDETYSHPRDSMMNQRDKERLESFRKSRMPKDIEILKAEIERNTRGA